MEEKRAASRPTEEETEGVRSGDRAPTVEPETAEETTMFGGEEEKEAEATEDETKTREEVEPSGDVASDEKDEPHREKEVEEEKTKEPPESSETVSQTEEGVGETDRSEPEAYLVTHHDTADAERLVAVTERLGKDVGDIHARTAFVVKACSVALGDAGFDGETDEAQTNIRVVTRNDDRTRSFVVEKVGNKGVAEIAAEIDSVGNASSEETTEEDFTVYDAGTVGREGTTPVPDRPGAAAVAVGEVRKRPCVVGDEVVARHTVPLSLTFDRTVADEAEAARFLEDLRRYVEEPAELFL
jgi:pyruvate dehydrogenase E2 component (dihydrolipoamide acetyltransferase)